MNKKLFPILATALFLFFLMAACGPAQISHNYNYGGVTGRVLYQNGSPVYIAYCTMKSNTTGTTYSRSTYDNGIYDIPQIPAGDYSLNVYKSGFQEVNLKVTIVKDETTTVEDVILVKGFTGPLTGTVTASDTGQAISGAAITIDAATAPIGATSDGNGRYKFSNLSSGSHTIDAVATGYQKFSSTVSIQNQTSNEFDIKMVSSASPTPEPGYGNVTGKVTDVNGLTLSDVEVTLQKGEKAVTDANGVYTVENLSPGTRTLSFAKTGYQSNTVDVNIEADTTVTAKTVVLTTSTETLVTTWASKRINSPEVNDALKPDVCNYGEKVVFHSSGNVVANWGSPVDTYQVYVWVRKTGTITRLSNSAIASSTQGANNNSTNARISGNGEYVVFQSEATNILPNGLSQNAVMDIYIVRLSDMSIARVSNDTGSANFPGNAASITPDINGDGTAVIFASSATNLDNLAPIANNGWSHIYGCQISNMTPSPRVMLDMRYIAGVATEGSEGGADPNSANPVVSYDGKCAAFQSRADNICANNPSTVAVHIFRCNTQGDPAVGWNTYITQNDGTDFPAGTVSLFPAINSDGTRIAFETNANIFTTNSKKNILLWKQESSKLTFISQQLTGAALNFKSAQIDNSGRYVSFLSDSGVGAPGGKEIVSDNISIAGMLYIKDTDAVNDNKYTYGSVGSSDQLPNQKVNTHAMSPDGSYIVFETTAKNLTSDTYTAGVSDIFIRKWK